MYEDIFSPRSNPTIIECFIVFPFLYWYLLSATVHVHCTVCKAKLHFLAPTAKTNAMLGQSINFPCWPSWPDYTRCKDQHWPPWHPTRWFSLVQPVWTVWPCVWTCAVCNLCDRLRRWYITIPSSDQWCTTIENHRYQWLSYLKTIGKPLIPMVALNHSIQWWW